MTIRTYCPSCNKPVDLDDDAAARYPVEEECCAECGDVLLPLYKSPRVGDRRKCVRVEILSRKMEDRMFAWLNGQQLEPRTDYEVSYIADRVLAVYLASAGAKRAFFSSDAPIL